MVGTSALLLTLLSIPAIQPSLKGVGAVLVGVFFAALLFRSSRQQKGTP